MIVKQWLSVQSILEVGQSGSYFPHCLLNWVIVYLVYIQNCQQDFTEIISDLKRKLPKKKVRKAVQKILLLFQFQFYKLFWTKACPEGIGTNVTHRSHARCHPYPIPQPVKVDHTTGVYDPYSFRIVMWVLLRPTRTNQ